MDLNLNYTEFGRYCVQRRRQLQRTLGMMAEALGVDTAYVSSVERGEIVPPECYVENVAAYFCDKIEYVKAKVLNLGAMIETTYEVIDRREIKWPENVVPYDKFRKRRWPTTSTPAD